MSELLMLVGAELADDVGRCAVAAGYSVVAGDVGDDGGEWLKADAVVVDADSVDRLAGSSVVRRRGVFLVCLHGAPPGVWQDALVIGASGGFELPAEEEGLVAALTDLQSPQSYDGRVLAILGGHGGAGSTTLSAATGLAAAQSGAGRVLLIGPDEVGAGIDLMLGIEGATGPRARDLNVVGGRLSHTALHEALPHAHRSLAVLAAGAGSERPLRAESVLAAVDAGRSGGDLVIVDVPRTQPGLQRELLRRADLIVLLSQGILAAIAATRATRENLAVPRGQVELVLRGPAPGGIPPVEMAAAVGVPLLDCYRSDPSLAARMETRPLSPGSRSPLGRIARRICERLDEVAS
ncbi:septum site-determining protein Ssd [Gordonia araii]|nr:septum site-determining protein Ssd [Gordonia araii]NNG98841.1 hypothetical protein [Gordonia araii NBRC 100433]